MNINELKLDHDVRTPYVAPKIEELETWASEKGSARFADVEVTYLYSFGVEDRYLYSVCGQYVSRSMAAKAFA